VPLGSPGDLVVRVLGPIEVTGWLAPPERRGVAEELCCFLAMHPDRAFTTAELLAALWPVGGGRGEATPKTLHNHLSRLRAAAGPEHLPDAAASGGYRLAGCVTDWGEFSRLSTDAQAASGEEADRLRQEALSLVRGAPFADARGGQYEWAFSSLLASQMTVAVADCARSLSADRLAAGDHSGAAEAAQAGLQAAPDDESLWLALARAAAPDPASLARVWRDATAAIGPDRVGDLRRRLEG
jgi:DNA-binding SARP family transcriptional activator